MESDEQDVEQSPTSALVSMATGYGLLPSSDQAEAEFEDALLSTANKVYTIELDDAQLKEKLAFWDERKVNDWRAQAGANKADIFVVPKEAIIGLKKIAAESSKVVVDDQFEREAVEKAYVPNVWLKGEVLLPPEPRQKKFPPGPKKVLKAFEKVNKLDPIYNDKRLCDMWETRNRSEAEKL